MRNERQVEFETFKFNLDIDTTKGDFKDNKINRKILSLSFSDSSSPNAKLKVHFKEGDSLILRPGRVIHLKEPSDGATFTWDSQPSEWATIEISDKVYFPSSDYLSNTTFMAEARPTKFKQTIETLINDEPKRVLENNQDRLYVTIYNNSEYDLRYGSKEDGDNYKTNGPYTSELDKVVPPMKKKKIFWNKELYLYINGSNADITLSEALI